MPLVFTDNLVKFDEVCAVEDAMPLVEHLRGHPLTEIDLSTCSYMHTALLQLLLLTKPAIVAAPADPFLVRWVVPLLTQSEGARI